jgi:hypothetical protein
VAVAAVGLRLFQMLMVLEGLVVWVAVAAVHMDFTQRVVLEVLVAVVAVVMDITPKVLAVPVVLVAAAVGVSAVLAVMALMVAPVGMAVVVAQHR